MQLQHIDLDQLKTTNLNVRKTGKKEISDLLPSVRSLGILQPLLVRKTRAEKCDSTSGKQTSEGYEVIAGQRRFHTAHALLEEGIKEPVPCIVMQEGDDAKAIEASLAENIARLPMDEIDQYKAFSELVKQDMSVEAIAIQFGVTERLVKQRLAIANLISPILNAYRKQEVSAETVRALTLATKAKQKEWWKLFNSEEYAPQGQRLKAWLFGGQNIPVTNALFEVKEYKGNIVSDLFGNEQYFDDISKFWELQSKAVSQAKEAYLKNGWQEVVILEVGDYWASWEYAQVPKTKGGKIYVQIANDGEVTFHEGYVTNKEKERLEKADAGVTDEAFKPERPELTKAMQNYLDLHRHSAVRTELLNHSAIALRLAVAQVIAGSQLWGVHADSQNANTDAIKESLARNKAEEKFRLQRSLVRKLLGLEAKGGTEKENDTSEGHHEVDATDDTIVPRKQDWDKSHDVHAIFAKLLSLPDNHVNTILTFVVAETLPSGSPLVEALGLLLKVDASQSIKPDETFLDLLRDKEAINEILKEIGGKTVAEAHTASTAKIQKGIIRDYLNGTRRNSTKSWKPRYMQFPMRAYTKRSGIMAIEGWKQVKKHYA